MIPAELPAETRLPEFVQIEPVGQCNLRCRMCPVVFRGDGGPGRAPAFMRFELFCELLEQFPGVKALQLQGLGEPLLHPRFFDMVAHAARRGIEVSANTNLTALSERRAEECVRSGLHRLYVSLDAASAEAFEYIRVGARFSRVLRNLERLNEAKRRLAAALPRIALVAVAMRRNLEELPALVRLAHAHGLQEVSVQHLCHDFSEASLPGRYAAMRAFVEAETLLGEDLARIERWFGEARAAARALGLELRLPRARPRPQARAGRARCDWPWRGAYVSYSGEAMPCCMVATPDRMNFGNMAREGVASVWNNAAYREFRERLGSDEPPEICRGCAVYNGTF
jgi:radical SAM protein with 4Fe4S-binding SPASM domain